MDPSLTVTVIDPRGISWPVQGWVAALIIKLVACHNEINAMAAGKLTADIGPSGLRLRVEKEIGRTP